MQPPPNFGAPAGYGYPQSGYGVPSSLTATRAMTIDDVVVRTVGLLAVTGIVRCGGLDAVPDLVSSPLIALAVRPSPVSSLGLVISFARITNPAADRRLRRRRRVCFWAWSAGAIEPSPAASCMQAVIGTFGIFPIMSMLYKFRVIRATPRFTPWSSAR